MPDELTPEAQAEALLQGEGFTVLPPPPPESGLAAPEVPQAPEGTPPAAPTKQSSLWKPLPQEFFLEEIQALAADISPDFSAVHFVMTNEVKDEVEGHTLTASVN
jgi:hypothetical protein